jgi:hypothetical protein
MFKKYLGPIKYLGTAALLVFGFGLIFEPLSEALFSEDTRDNVLVLAIPFVSVFITIILLYILLIFMVALRFNGKIPYRTYRPIELTIIGGILLGIFCLFQPWQVIGYEYGFLLLVGSTIGFIMWSHVRPQSAAAGQSLAPFQMWHHAVAIAVALVVVGVLALNLTENEKPGPPYGYTQRQWDRGLRDEQKAQVEEEAQNTYERYEVPFLIIFSLGPGLYIYFISREVLASVVGKAKNTSQAVSVTNNSH